ncbi:MAG: disulfide bond formation protein B [Thiotrichaceae bacterium]|nr:disulfide bond formation protein B [Thiotrichaceae bacterium]
MILNLVHSRLFWLALIAFGFMLEGVALFYQYIVEDPPCVLCIHFRLLVLALILVAIIGVIVARYKIPSLITSILLLIVFAGMLERSVQLLGVEYHFILGDCTMASGLPSWFAVGEWVPWFFKVETTCGYTPVLVFGITMAESLLVMSIGLVIMSLLMLWVQFRNLRR